MKTTLKYIPKIENSKDSLNIVQPTFIFIFMKTTPCAQVLLFSLNEISDSHKKRKKKRKRHKCITYVAP